MIDFYGWAIDYTNMRVLGTDDEVSEINALEEKLNSKIRWKLGDPTYWRKADEYRDQIQVV